MSDKEYHKEKALEKAAHDIIRIAGRRELKRRFDESEEESTKTFRLHPRILALAAAVLMLFTAAFWLFQNEISKTGEELFAENFEAFQAPITLRGIENEAAQNWTKAIDSYSKSNFDLALTFFEGFSKTQSSAEDFKPAYLSAFYIGNCLLAKSIPEPEKAKKAFQEVLTIDNDYHHAARWYLGLAHLKLGEVEEAKNIFEEIAISAEPKSEDALKVLNSLKK